MRLVAFIAYMFFLLTNGGENLHATTYRAPLHTTSEQKVGSKRLVKFVADDRGVSFIEDSDNDVEEEYGHQNDVKEDTFSKIVYLQPLAIHQRVLPSLYTLLNSSYVRRHKITPPFCGFKSPLFITQRVIRI